MTEAQRAVRVLVGGELDVATVGSAGRAVERAIRAGGEVHLDLSAVSFIDGAGLRAVERWLARAAALDVRCEVVATSEAVTRVQRLLRVAASR